MDPCCLSALLRQYLLLDIVERMCRSRRPWPGLASLSSAVLVTQWLILSSSASSLQYFMANDVSSAKAESLNHPPEQEYFRWINSSHSQSHRTLLQQPQATAAQLCGGTEYFCGQADVILADTYTAVQAGNCTEDKGAGLGFAEASAVLVGLAMNNCLHTPWSSWCLQWHVISHHLVI